MVNSSIYIFLYGNNTPGYCVCYLLINFVVVCALIFEYLVFTSYTNKFVQVVYIADVLPMSYNNCVDLPKPPGALIRVY